MLATDDELECKCECKDDGHETRDCAQAGVGFCDHPCGKGVLHFGRPLSVEGVCTAVSQAAMLTSRCGANRLRTAALVVPSAAVDLVAKGFNGVANAVHGYTAWCGSAIPSAYSSLRISVTIKAQARALVDDATCIALASPLGLHTERGCWRIVAENDMAVVESASGAARGQPSQEAVLLGLLGKTITGACAAREGAALHAEGERFTRRDNRGSRRSKAATWPGVGTWCGIDGRCSIGDNCRVGR